VLGAGTFSSPGGGAFENAAFSVGSKAATAGPDPRETIFLF
jgi:hypothetical protein